MNNLSKSYAELIRIPTYEDRIEYLRLHGSVGEDTFGFDRYMNQMLYRSREWKLLRQQIIMRDKACDLGVDGYDIFDKRNVIIHHINPITPEMIAESDSLVFDPNNLITTTLFSHNIIHYGWEKVSLEPIERSKNDTCPWRK